MNPQTYVIPERFAFDEDTSLKVFLRENQGAAVEINAANLRKIDSLLLQYLIAASRAWAARGHRFEITQVPADLNEAFVQLGISQNSLCWKVAA